MNGLYYNEIAHYVVATTNGDIIMNYSFLSNTALFHGIREDELQEMLPCLNAHEREYQKMRLF